MNLFVKLSVNTFYVKPGLDMPEHLPEETQSCSLFYLPSRALLLVVSTMTKLKTLGAQGLNLLTTLSTNILFSIHFAYVNDTFCNVIILKK